MKQLFLSPRASETAYENFKSTLADGVKVNRIEPYLSDTDKEVLSNYETVFVWGAQPSIRNKWEKIQNDDYILFYKDYHFIQASEVIHTTFNEDLALELWPRSADTGEPWSCLYFVKNLRPINLHIKEFNEIADYNMRALMGFQRVTENHLKKILQSFGILDNFIESLSLGLTTYEMDKLENLSVKDEGDITYGDMETLDDIVRTRDIDDLLAELTVRNMDKKPEEIEVKRTRIKRDYTLVQVLKEKHEYKCQICGFTFKTSSGGYYCEAAHIKPVSSREEGVDIPENILILCPNHHKMLDYGAIKIVAENTLEVEGKIIKIS